MLENTKLELENVSVASKNAFKKYLGNSGRNTHMRIGGANLGLHNLVNYSEIATLYADALQGEKGGVYKDTADGSHHSGKFAFALTQAMLYRGMREHMEKVMSSDRAKGFAAIDEALKIYPSKDPLDKLFTQEKDDDLVLSYRENYKMLKEREDGLLRQAVKAIHPSYIPDVSLSNCAMVTARGVARDTDWSNVGADTCRRALSSWIEKSCGSAKFGALMEKASAVMTEVELRNLLCYVNTQIANAQLSSRSVSAADMICDIPEVLNNESITGRNCATALPFRTYTSAPIVTNGNLHLRVDLKNNDLHGALPSLIGYKEEAHAKDVAEKDRYLVINQSDASIFAYVIGRCVLAHVIERDGEVSGYSLTFSDILIDFTTLLDEELVYEVLYECVKTQIKPMQLDYYNFIDSAIATKHSMKSVNDLQTMYIEMLRKDCSSYSRTLHDNMTIDLSSDIGVAIDKIKAKYGSRRNWIFSPMKADQEYALNSGGLANIVQSGTVSFKTKYGVQFVKDWPVGECEGSAEVLYVRDKYRKAYYVDSVSQDEFNAGVTPVSTYFSPQNTRLRIDLNAGPAMTHLAEFKLGDRFFTNGKVPDLLKITDFTKLVRTQIEGDATLFEFNGNETQIKRLPGSIVMIERSGLSYRSTDRSLNVSRVKQRDSGVHDTTYKLGTDVIYALTVDLLNGYFSNMVPETMTENTVSLKQTQTTALKRIENMDEMYDQVKIDRALVTLFTTNPLLHKTTANLFPADQLWALSNSELLVRKDVVLYMSKMFDFHIDVFKYNFGDVRAIKHAMSYLRGELTETSVQEMKREARGMNIVHELINVIVKVAGFSANDGQLSGSQHIAMRMMCLNIMSEKLAKYDELVVDELMGDIDASLFLKNN